MSSLARLRSWTLAHQRWFALGSVFSLFSLVALITGDAAWLSYLGFLGCLGFLALQNGARPADPAQGQPDRAASPRR
jgi:hypothetical protein